MEKTTEFWELIIKFVSSYKFYVPIITIIVSIILVKTSKSVVKRLINKEAKSVEVKRKNTIIALIENIIKYLIIIIAFLIILSVWGINVSGIVTGLGVVGIVAGLAIQDGLKDVIMGCNIIMDNYFVVGDIVTFDGFTGEIIEFSLKQTKIKNVDGTVLVVGNRNISMIQNLSQKNANVMITVPTSYDANQEKIEKILEEICEIISKHEYSIEDAKVLGLDSFGDSSVNYLLQASCTAVNRFKFKRAILAIIKKEFDKNHVEIPFTQIVVHNG